MIASRPVLITFYVANLFDLSRLLDVSMAM
jgi:hypothetical protein